MNCPNCKKTDEPPHKMACKHCGYWLANIPACRAEEDSRSSSGYADEGKRDQAHRLAMLALQSESYISDVDLAEATDAVLRWSKPRNPHTMPPQRPLPEKETEL